MSATIVTNLTEWEDEAKKLYQELPALEKLSPQQRADVLMDDEVSLQYEEDRTRVMELIRDFVKRVMNQKFDMDCVTNVYIQVKLVELAYGTYKEGVTKMSNRLIRR